MLKVFFGLVSLMMIVAIVVCGNGVNQALSFLLLSGILISGTLLKRTANMIEDKAGNRVRVVGFTSTAFGPLKDWLKDLPERSIGLILKWLRIDYLFMLFLYPFLAVITLILTDPGCTILPWKIDWRLSLLILVGLTACMDALENWFAIWFIEGLNEFNSSIFARYMRLFSFGKWIGAGLLILLFLMLFWPRFTSSLEAVLNLIIFWFRSNFN